jgi:D-glycero-D-manno-heptose 1,7-bisphosphate phosphatase
VRALSPGGVAFLDRDGTINQKVEPGRYVTGPDELRLLDGAATAIRRLNDAGATVIVVTNQRGIALGRMTEGDLKAVHARLESLLETEAGARLDAILHCPHERGSCDCRKPAPGLLLQARRRWPWIELGASVMIGDSVADVVAGQAVGAQTMLLGDDAEDLADAVDHLLGVAGRV